MSSWIRIAAIEDCPPGAGRELVVENRIVALFNVDGDFYALDGVCPHQGGPLGQGAVEGCVVTCPWHGWQFDVTTGQHQSNLSLVHTRFPVKVEDGSVYVELPDPD